MWYLQGEMSQESYLVIKKCFPDLLWSKRPANPGFIFGGNHSEIQNGIAKIYGIRPEE